MSENNKRLARRWFEEVWNQGRREAIAEMMAADCVVHDADTSIKGIAAFQQYFDRLQGAFSDTHFEIEEALAERDLVCVRWSVTVRHAGDNLGMPATGRSLRATGITIVRIAGEKFVEGWQNLDMLGLMQQIQGGPRAPLYMSDR